MKATLHLHFDSYWQAGTGKRGGADLDEFFDRDDDGLPLLRGKRLKGLLKDAASLHQQYKPCCPISIEAAFGEEGGSGKSPGAFLDIRNAVIVKDRDHLLRREAEFSGLSQALSGTAMQDEGIAKAKTLRSVEAAIPMSLEAVIEWSDKHENSKEIIRWLENISRLLRYAGRHRHRGLGRCRVDIIEIKPPPTDHEQSPTDKKANPDIEIGSVASPSQSLTLKLTLTDDVVISARAATAGPHETLDYLPGSVLWGAVSSLYGQWAGIGQWDKVQSVFHSGKVRFLPGRPWVDVGTALVPAPKALLPAPLAWHFKKGAKFHEHNKLANSDDDVKLRSLSATAWDFDKDHQPQQVRGGWFSPAGDYHTVRRVYQDHTAVKSGTFDRAEDGKFFGYNAIKAGQSFLVRIEADPGTHGWTEVVNLLKKRRELRFGRSKSAEYGRAEVEVVADTDWTEPEPSKPSAQLLVFHALSDLAFVDKHGQPTLIPEPAHFCEELVGWELDGEHTYTQVRSYSPWNRHRGSHDAERQVLKMGSVIAFKPAEDTQVAPVDFTKLPRRVGQWQEQGLGVVAINPAYLFTVPTAEPVPPVQQDKTTPTSPSDDASPLIKTMHRRFCQRTMQRLAVALGREWALKWREGRMGSGLSKSQWARLREEAVAAPSRKSLLDSLDSPDRGLFQHGLSKLKWESPEQDTPAKRIRATLTDNAVLKDELIRVGVPATAENISTLAQHACREAAIACARAKRND